jgi:hypothetical protein
MLALLGAHPILHVSRIRVNAVIKVKCISFSQLAKDLLHPSPAEEKRKHKLKRLVQHPNSYFMDVKCPGKPHIDLQL